MKLEQRLKLEIELTFIQEDIRRLFKRRMEIVKMLCKELKKEKVKV